MAGVIHLPSSFRRLKRNVKNLKCDLYASSWRSTVERADPISVERAYKHRWLTWDLNEISREATYLSQSQFGETAILTYVKDRYSDEDKWLCIRRGWRSSGLPQVRQGQMSSMSKYVNDVGSSSSGWATKRLNERVTNQLLMFASKIQRIHFFPSNRGSSFAPTGFSLPT